MKLSYKIIITAKDKCKKPECQGIHCDCPYPQYTMKFKPEDANKHLSDEVIEHLHVNLNERIENE
jgi:hypothetical protein